MHHMPLYRGTCAGTMLQDEFGLVRAYICNQPSCQPSKDTKCPSTFDNTHRVVLFVTHCPLFDGAAFNTVLPTVAQ